MTEYKLFAQRVCWTRGNHESHCESAWINSDSNFNEDPGRRRLRHLVSNNGYHLATISSGAFGINFCDDTILSRKLRFIGVWVVKYESIKVFTSKYLLRGKHLI